MIGDQLSKQEDRILHRALESVVRTQFPNPRRNDCPGIETLRAIATKRISMRDPAVDHVGRCSPCFSELTDLRHAIHRRNVLWKAGTAAAAVVVLAVLASYFGFTSDAPNVAGPTQPRYETALLDLRNASIPRSVQPSNSSPNQPAPEIPRARLGLTIQLPIGSEAGTYELQITRPNEPARLTSKAQAKIEHGITLLLIDVDTTQIQSGEYQLGWRTVDSDWRYQLILIR
jgi:hypothetical protein